MTLQSLEKWQLRRAKIGYWQLKFNFLLNNRKMAFAQPYSTYVGSPPPKNILIICISMRLKNSPLHSKLNFVACNFEGKRYEMVSYKNNSLLCMSTFFKSMIFKFSLPDTRLVPIKNVCTSLKLDNFFFENNFLA